MERKNSEQIKASTDRVIDSSVTHLSSKEIREARSLVRHREYGVAWELVVTQLYEHESEIDEGLYLLIAESGKLMGFPSEEWEHLRSLVRDS